MTAPNDIVFVDESLDSRSQGTIVSGEEADALPNEVPDSPYPPPVIELPQEEMDKIKRYVSQQIHFLDMAHEEKRKEFRDIETAYHAHPDAPKSIPYEGADTTTVPVIAMSADPVHARLDTSIFKQDPVMTIKGHRPWVHDRVDSLSKWIEYYQKYRLRLRKVVNPALVELTQIGTCVLKVVYDREEYRRKTYDSQWNVVDKVIKTFSGPRVYAVPISNLGFRAHRQHIQQSDFVFERIRMTRQAVMRAAQGDNPKFDPEVVKRILNQTTTERTDEEIEREKLIKHGETVADPNEIEFYECYFEYATDDPNESGEHVKKIPQPDNFIGTFHLPTLEFVQLRYHWYFHQRKPYIVIPFNVQRGTIYGIGIGQMTLPFQMAITKMQRMSIDNAYLANTRMFIANRNAQTIEESPRIFAGRTFWVDDPSKDFVPFAMAEIYPSTLVERQNLFGLAEKRTGVSDYLTGRESPIIGSRATATSTLALIQEGTRRVEEVLENIREGFDELWELCMYIWIQYGLEGQPELVFGADNEVTKDLNELFAQLKEENIPGALTFDLTATNAGNNRQVMQQMQLAIIQIMMQYLEKVLAAGQAALQAQQTVPQFAEMIKEVMRAARAMFKDLLDKYDIRNAEKYLPDLEKYLGGQDASGGALTTGSGESAGPAGGPQDFSGVPVRNGTLPAPAVPTPTAPGAGRIADRVAAAAGPS